MKVYSREGQKSLGIEVVRALRFFNLHLKTNTVNEAIMMIEQSYGKQVAYYMLREIGNRIN